MIIKISHSQGHSMLTEHDLLLIRSLDNIIHSWNLQLLFHHFDIVYVYLYSIDLWLSGFCLNMFLCV